MQSCFVVPSVIIRSDPTLHHTAAKIRYRLPVQLLSHPHIASFSNIHTVDTNDNSTVAIRFCKVLHLNWLVAKIIFGTIQIPCRLSYRYVSLLVIGLKVKQTFNCNETFGPIGMPIYIHIVQHSTRFVGTTTDHRYRKTVIDRPGQPINSVTESFSSSHSTDTTLVVPVHTFILTS